VSGVLICQKTWPPLLKIEHRVKLQFLPNNLKTVTDIRVTVCQVSDSGSWEPLVFKIVSSILICQKTWPTLHSLASKALQKSVLGRSCTIPSYMSYIYTRKQITLKCIQIAMAIYIYTIQLLRVHKYTLSSKVFLYLL